MKEFTSQVGGRYTYIDDIINLQELSLAIVSMFDGCDNFIISGCQITDSSMSSGYVYINGKIRYCAGTSGISTWPIYIYEQNTVENVSYENSTDKEGRKIYSCAVSSQLPVSQDSITGEVPQFIKITSSSDPATRLKDAFFGKYALILDGTYLSQQIKNGIIVDGNITSSGSMESHGELGVRNGTNKCSLSLNSHGEWELLSVYGGIDTYKMVMTKQGSCKFFANDKLVATIDNKGFMASVPITANSIYVGGIRYSGYDIYNNGTAADNGELKINVVGYSGETSYFRDTVIGNGKGQEILRITGKTGSCNLSGNVMISSPNANPFKITHSSLLKTDKNLRSSITWQDKNAAKMATIGYDSDADFDFYIKNTLGNIRINSNTYIAGNLYVGGLDVMSTLANKKEMTSALSTKADTSNVYAKSDADKMFIKRTDSISVFVEQAGGGDIGKKSVCNTIGASTTSDFNKTVQKSQLFKDIVAEGLPSNSDGNYTQKLQERQRALCANIGALYKDDALKAPKDTGWIEIATKDVGTVYVRQVGYVVSIQGHFTPPSKGTVFTLPNQVDPPKHLIAYSYCKGGGEWNCIINEGSRDCIVDTCRGSRIFNMGFLMTYII